MTASLAKTKDMMTNFSQEDLNTPNLIIEGELIECVSTSKPL